MAATGVTVDKCTMMGELQFSGMKRLLGELTRRAEPSGLP